MKCRFFIFLLLTSLFATAQVKQFSQPFDFSHLHTGDTFSMVIKNNDTLPIEFYPLTVFDNDSSRLFETNTSFFNYIKSAGDAMAQIKRLAYFLKSDRFVNNYIVFSDMDPGIKRKKFSSPMFFLGNSQEQCGNYSDFATSCLIATGALSSDSIFYISLSGHQVAECIINGDSILLDYDPFEPAFLNTLPNGKYYSAMDVLIQPQYMNSLYTYTDPVTGITAPLDYLGLNLTRTDSALAVKHQFSQYTAFFDTSMRYEPAYTGFPSKDTGSWKLPAGSSLEWHWKAPLFFTQNQIDSIGTLISADANLAEMVNAVKTVTNYDSATIMRAILHLDIIAADSTPNQVVLDMSYSKSDTLDLYVTTTDKPVVIGKDLRLPFWVHRITTDQPVTIGDTTFPAGNSYMWLWNEKGDIDSEGFANNSQAPDISEPGIAKLQSGLIPAHCHVHMSLYYNERIYAIPNGFKAEMLSGNFDSLVVSTQATLHTDSVVVIPTGSQAGITVANDFNIYPNPTTGILLIDAGNGFSPGTVDIYNSIGVLCLSATLENQRQLISIGSLANGIYTVKFGKSCQKIVKM